MEKKLLTLNGMQNYELPNQCGIFNHCIYVGNITCLYTKSFCIQLLSPITHLPFDAWLGSVPLLYEPHLGDYSVRGQSRHLVSGKEPGRNLGSSIRNVENDIPKYLICNWWFR